MGLVNEYMVKQAIGKTAGQTLELEADPGQSFLVKNVLVGNNSALKTDITIDKAMVGRFKTSATYGNHLSFPYGMATPDDAAEMFILKPRQTVLDYLGDLGIFTGFPIAEGQKMVISPLTTASDIGDVQIVYEEYEGGDITSEMENGSESTEYMIINYGDVGSAITGKKDYLVNTQNSPTEFPAFPYDKVVPAKTEIDLIAILASTVYDWDDASHISYSKYLKLVKERTVLFDDDRNGLLFLGEPYGATDVKTTIGGGESVLGGYSTVDIKKPYILPTPITFGAGEELNVYITSDIVTNAASISRAASEIGLVMKIRRVS